MSKLLQQLVLACFFSAAIGGCSQPEYVAVDTETNTAFLVLKGYLKRRDGQLEKTETTVKHIENGYIFRWQATEGERQFRVEQQNNAWKIIEITDSTKKQD